MTSALEIDGFAVRATRSADGEKGSKIELTLPRLPDLEACLEKLPIHFIVYCTPISGDKGCTISYKSGQLFKQNSKLLFSSSGKELPSNCIYNITIEIISSTGRANSTGYLLMSTYDVQNVMVTPVAGALSVSGVLATNTHALGCLFIIKSSSSSRSSPQLYQTAVNNNNMCTTNVSILGEDISIWMYDLERDGLPSATPAIFTSGVVVSQNVPSTPQAFQSKVLVSATIENSTESELKVACKFRADVIKQSETECLVIWHQKGDVWLNSVKLNMFTSVIIVNQSGEYSVAVFGVREGELEQHPFLMRSMVVKKSIIVDSSSAAEEPTSNTAAIAVGATAFVLVIIILLVLLLTASLMWCYHRRRFKMEPSAVNPDTQANEAYEQRKPHQMTENVAYELSTPCNKPPVYEEVH